MNADIRAFIRNLSYCKDDMHALARMLPGDDGELDAMIADTVTRSDRDEFIFIVIAALSAGRAVQARHLERGLFLMPNISYLGLLATHMQGDVSKPLLTAVRNIRPDSELIVPALFLAAHAQKQCGCKTLSSDLIAATRLRARAPSASPTEQVFLYLVARMSGDHNLINSLPQRSTDYEEAAEKEKEGTLNKWCQPVSSCLPETASRPSVSGITVRRAVPRIGRNKLCPCGSGKKYKKCCSIQDQQRLQNSSEVTGVTRAELREDTERYLDQLQLENLDDHTLARLDPSKIAAELRIPFLTNLYNATLLDRAVEALGKWGCADGDLQILLEKIMIEAADIPRKDLVERLLRLHPESADSLLLRVELLLAEDRPAELMRLLTEHSLSVVRNDNSSDLVGFAVNLLNSQFGALGILVARGVMLYLEDQDTMALWNNVLKTGDRLNLPLDDHFTKIMGEISLQDLTDVSAEAEAARDALSKYKEKNQEVQRCKAEIDRLQRVQERREKLTPAPVPINTTPPRLATVAEVSKYTPTEGRRDKAAREATLRQLKNELHAMRHNLQKALTECDQLRKQKARTVVIDKTQEEADYEDDGLLPHESVGTQPIRLIEFPHQFKDSLMNAPRAVSRKVMCMLGELAAGDPAAFHGACWLQACPDVMRQRIGEYRLLFRLLPDVVQVVDLIPRQDLERKIKTLV